MQNLLGYDLVRELPGAERGEMHLARGPEGRLVVVRVLPADGDGEEDRFLETVDSDHVLPVIDVGTLDDGRVLVVSPRVAGGSLGELLADRPVLAAGECTTALVAVARGLADLHAAGWGHGRLDPANVLLTAAGEPVIVGLGRARPLDDAARDADLESLGALVRLLLERVPGGVPTGLASDGVMAPETIEQRMLDFADPLPLSRVPVRSAADVSRPRFDDLLGDEPEPALRGTIAAAVYGMLPSELRERTSPVFAAAHAAVTTARESLGQVRPRAWAAAGFVGVALLAALVVLPGGEPARPLGGAAGPDSAAVATASPAPVATSAGTEPSSAEERGTGESAVPARVPADQRERGDDPLDAALALIDRRQRCFQARSVECLADVVQPDSAAAEDHAAAVRRIEGGAVPPAPIVLGDAPFVQRTGDSALVSGTTVSLLLVRGGDGWRIRDIFDAPQRLEE